MAMSITTERARKLVSKGAVVVDVRNAVAFRDKSIPGSKNCSLIGLSQIQQHPKTTPVIVVIDRDDPDTASAAVRYVSMVYGFERVHTYASVNEY